jgi:hypothetical protein
MALSGEENKVILTLDEGDTILDFNIPFFDVTPITSTKYGDIRLTRKRSGVELILTPNASPSTAQEYSLSPTNSDPSQGGRITLGAGATQGDQYVIEREVPYTQQYNLQEGASIDPTALNKAFDRTVAQNQQQNDLFTRTVQFPVTDSSSTTYTVGTEATRANKALGFDVSGNVTELDLVSSETITGDTNKGISILGNQIATKIDSTSMQFINGNIAVKEVSSSQIADNSITSNKLASNSVSKDNITSGALTDLVYPVGSIFTTVTNYVDSAGVVSAIGGTTWVPFGAGRVMVGFDNTDASFNSIEQEGGSKTVVLNKSQIPPHTHSLVYDQISESGSGFPASNLLGTGDTETTNAGDDLGENNDGTGNAAPHDNLQPYVVVYMWKRTA